MVGLRRVWIAAVMAAGGCSDDAPDTSGTDSDGTTTTDATVSTTVLPSTSGPSTSGTETLDGSSESGSSQGSSESGETELEVSVEVTQYRSQPMVVDVSLTTNVPVSAVSLTHATDDGVVIDGGGAETDFSYRVRGLAPATLHAISWDVDGEQGEFDFTTNAPLPGFMPSFPVDPGVFADEAPYRMFDLIPFPAFDTAGVFMVDGAGVTRWHLGAPSNKLPGPEGVWTAAKVRADGTMMYLHLHEFFIVNELGETIANFTDNDLGVTGLHHEVLELDSGNFLALTHTFQDVDYGADGILNTAGDGIVEFTPEGDVVWEWDTFDYLDPQRVTEPFAATFVIHPETSELTYDWTHSNGIEYDEASGEMLLSIRHQDWIINIDHTTGDIVWILGEGGDFTLETGEWFFHPHSPQWQPDGSLLLYDNGIGNPAVLPDEYESRAVRYDIDTGLMTASVAWEDDAEPFQAPFAGDADLLPESGNYLVTDSSIFDELGLVHSRIRELDPEGTPMTQWELLTPPGTFVYRAIAQPRILGATP